MILEIELAIRENVKKVVNVLIAIEIMNTISIMFTGTCESNRRTLERIYEKLLSDKFITSFDFNKASNKGAKSTRLTISNPAVIKLNSNTNGNFHFIYLYKILVMKSKLLIMAFCGYAE